jgi:putative membrane protein
MFTARDGRATERQALNVCLIFGMGNLCKTIAAPPTRRGFFRVRTNKDENNMKAVCLFSVIAIAVGICCLSAPSQAASLSSSDRAFIKNAAYGGNTEIAFSKIALRKSHDADVRNLAQMMITQHMQMGHQLLMVANNLGVRLPHGVAPAELPKELELEVLTGHAFDKAYIGTMVKDHVGADHLFQYGATADNGQVRNFAVSNLPTIENHLKMAAELQQKMTGHRMASMKM